MDLERLTSINNNLKKITQSYIEQKLEKVILSKKDEIVDKVRQRWKRGLRPNGDIIGVYRNFFYQQEKQQRNPLAGGNVDLIDTGSLNRELIVESHGRGLFTIFSTDEKALLIAEKYGLDVYGLTDEEQIAAIGEGLLEVNKEIINEL